MSTSLGQTVSGLPPQIHMYAFPQSQVSKKKFKSARHHKQKASGQTHVLTILAYTV